MMSAMDEYSNILDLDNDDDLDESFCIYDENFNAEDNLVERFICENPGDKPYELYEDDQSQYKNYIDDDLIESVNATLKEAQYSDYKWRPFYFTQWQFIPQNFGVLKYPIYIGLTKVDEDDHNLYHPIILVMNNKNGYKRTYKMASPRSFEDCKRWIETWFSSFLDNSQPEYEQPTKEDDDLLE